MNHFSEESIMTVRGYIPAGQLGFCHSHEHLFLADGQSAKINAALRIDDYKKTVAELVLYKTAGGCSIVDAQPMGCGRMAGNLYRASVESGIAIIASTGFHKLMFYPPEHWIHQIDVEEFTRLLVSEFECGMYTDADTHYPMQRISARPGVIKTASDTEGVSGPYRTLFTAAAHAARMTGAPIMSHTEMGKAALEQIELFTGHGVPVESLILCHLDRNLENTDYQLEVAKTGVFLEFDTIGRFKYHSDEDEAEFLVKLVEKGHEDQILLGLDTTRERLKNYGGSLGLDYLIDSFLPLLKSYGLTNRILHKFMVDNPARAFIKKYPG